MFRRRLTLCSSAVGIFSIVWFHSLLSSFTLVFVNAQQQKSIHPHSHHDYDNKQQDLHLDADYLWNNETLWEKMSQANTQEQNNHQHQDSSAAVASNDDNKECLLTQLRQEVHRLCSQDTAAFNNTTATETSIHDENNNNSSSSNTTTNPTTLTSQQQQSACESILRDTAQLQRNLIARQNHVDKAATLVMEQVRFRAKWNPSHITPHMIPNGLPSGAFRICGYSKEGHVLINFKLRFWEPNTFGKAPATTTTIQNEDSDVPLEQKDQNDDDDDNDDLAVQEFVRYVVYILELALRCTKPSPTSEKLLVLFDLRGFSLGLVMSTRVRRMISRLIYVVQAQYPERLAKVYLLYAPFGFAMAWQLLRPLLDERTAQKVHFTNDNSLLVNDIDPTVLSEDYGGTHGEYPLPTKTLQEEWQQMNMVIKNGSHNNSNGTTTTTSEPSCGL